MPAIRRQTTLANRTGVVFALNTPMREIRYLQTRILTGIQAIDQFILNYTGLDPKQTNIKIIRLRQTAHEITQHISDGIDLCTSAANSTTLQNYKYKPVFDDFNTILQPMVFVLDSYANELTIKEKRTALHQLDGIPPPPPGPRPSIAEFYNEYDFDEDEYVFTSSSDNATSSDDDE
jgi:hypothetical protein